MTTYILLSYKNFTKIKTQNNEWSAHTSDIKGKYWLKKYDSY